MALFGLFFTTLIGPLSWHRLGIYHGPVWAFTIAPIRIYHGPVWAFTIAPISIYHGPVWPFTLASFGNLQWPCLSI